MIFTASRSLNNAPHARQEPHPDRSHLPWAASPQHLARYCPFRCRLPRPSPPGPGTTPRSPPPLLGAACGTRLSIGAAAFSPAVAPPAIAPGAIASGALPASHRRYAGHRGRLRRLPRLLQPVKLHLIGIDCVFQPRPRRKRLPLRHLPHHLLARVARHQLLLRQCIAGKLRQRAFSAESSIFDGFSCISNQVSSPIASTRRHIARPRPKVSRSSACSTRSRPSSEDCLPSAALHAAPA